MLGNEAIIRNLAFIMIFELIIYIIIYNLVMYSSKLSVMLNSFL
jgi:hypothetical protein